MKKIFAILLSLMIMISAIPASLAAPVADATIDETATGGHQFSAHMISSFSSTGPSRQIRLYPVIVLQLQPMQAPKPQPIRSSKENWPDVFTARYTARSIGSGPQV